MEARNSAIGCRFPSARPSPGLVTGLPPDVNVDQVRCLWTVIASMCDVCHFSFNNLFSVLWQLCFLAMSTGVVPVSLESFLDSNPRVIHDVRHHATGQ
jgi:hypothetical protein